MGIFAQWQPRYAERGIATFPVEIVDGRKKPLVAQYLKMGVPASNQLALRFGGADMLGFAVGARSRITILDVDTADERVLADALAEHGPTPLIAKSVSGHFHAYYRHKGEGRRIRPNPKRPIDILGGGFTVAPPSQSINGRYQFIEGSLDDIASLPVMRAPALSPEPGKAKDAPRKEQGRDVGTRNDGLWRACMKHAALNCQNVDDVRAFARIRNLEFDPPLLEAEVDGIAASAWKYTEEGKNWFHPACRVVTIDKDTTEQMAATDPNAYALLALLKSWHGGRDEFVLAKECATKIGWTLPAFKKARNHLEAAHEIRCIHRGGRGPNDPPKYRWP